jgi:hypothetical protein
MVALSGFRSVPMSARMSAQTSGFQTAELSGFRSVPMSDSQLGPLVRLLEQWWTR